MTKERGQTAYEADREGVRVRIHWEEIGRYAKARWIRVETTIRNAALEEAADVIFNESVKHYAEGKSISDPYLSAVQLARADGLALASSAIRAMKEPT